MESKHVIVVVVGGALVAAGGLGLACSNTDTPPTGLPPTAELDSGRGSDSQIDSGGGGDAGADCGKPLTLHPSPADGGIHCPFSAVDGGKNISCARTDQCCQSPRNGPPSTCVTKGAACPTADSTVWECEGPADCAGGQKCCAHSGDGGVVTIQQDTCGHYLSKFKGTQCAALCGPGELVVCESQSECTSGTCTAVEPKAHRIGVCK
jgi:hypothetical protein